MAIWTWTGTRYEKCPWHKTNISHLKAMIYGCGTSLNTANVAPSGYFRIVQNKAYERVVPHVWVGLDTPDIFSKEHTASAYRKVYRGNHGLELVDGIPAREYPETYFADVVPLPKEEIFTQKGLNCQFVWQKNTLTVAIQLAIYMGFKTIGFTGIDLQGDYFDNRTLTDAEQKKIDMLLAEEFEFMKWLCSAASLSGIALENHSPNSRLCEIMKTV